MFPYLNQNKQNRLISPLSLQKQMPRSSGSEVSLCNTRKKQCFGPISKGCICSCGDAKNQKPVYKFRLVLGNKKDIVRSDHTTLSTSNLEILHTTTIKLEYQSRLSSTAARISQPSIKFTFFLNCGVG